MSLVLERLVITGTVQLTPAAGGDAPVLWPLGLYEGVGARLNISDVRLLVQAADFQAYVAAVQRQPRSVAQYQTDGSSFLHIASWRSSRTHAHSVTLLTGPCLPATPPGPAAAALTDLAAALEAAAPRGCNVRAVSNATLLPVLRAGAGVPTPVPLLVLITANVSLGWGLRAGAIAVQRPVALVGLYSAVTSMDLYMVVNQLNVTSKHSKVWWQSLYIENAAPGDATSNLLSRPMSGAVSANVFAVYCDRLHNCLNLNNCTVVLASQEEMNYLNFMYSMFNAALPNLRAATTFYHSELRCVVIQMGPGPEGGMMVYNLTCGAWDIYRTVFTTHPAVAIRLPFPPNAPLITAATKAGPLVQAVRDCASLQEAMQFHTIATRLHEWMLLGDINLRPPSDPDCWKNREIRYPTQLFGQRQGTAPDASGGGGASSADAGGNSSSSGSGAGPSFFAFDFAYMQDALLLPPAVEDRFFSIHNTTLQRLPQGPAPNTDAAPGKLAPDAFTLLLWSINRTRRSGDPVYLSDVVAWLPQPEYDFLAARAAAASSFVVQLEGANGDITFTGTTAEPGGVRVAWFDGPGLIGTNVLLKAAATSGLRMMPAAYYFPPSDAAGPLTVAASGRHSLSGGEVAGVVLGAVAGFVLALLACTLLHVRRRRAKQQHQELGQGKQGPSAPDALIGGSHGRGRKAPPGAVGGGNGHVSPGECVRVDVVQDRDGAGAGGGDGATVAAAAAAAAGAGAAAACRSPSTSNSGTPPSSGEPTHEGLPVAASSTTSGSVVGPAPSSSVVPSSSTTNDSVSLGMERWRAAISSTTMQLMERRMQLAHGSSSSNGGSSSTTRSPLASSSTQGQPGAPAAAAGAALGAQQATRCGGGAAGGSTSNQLIAAQQVGLQIHRLIGSGSFGSVWLGTWMSKRVAVKIMQLPATGLLSSAGGSHGALPEQGHRLGHTHEHQANSPPHMAIMEAVVSSTMSHPNVVQVYTYMLSPQNGGGGGGGGMRSEAAGDAGDEAADAVLQDGLPGGSRITGYELKLVMELCTEGTLRDALDQRLLPRTPSGFLPLKIVLSLAHDVAAALVHLHNQGIIHGDLKAANCMLTRGGSEDTHVTAKVADFGLALPLDPSDTHATLAARGTPTHMSPELFMSGHVSKASDVYAYGILLYELMSGQRAYAGVPVPLLPHEVAVKGVRPLWPPELPAEFGEVRVLAEACWTQLPQDRPTIVEVFGMLELLVQEHPPKHPLQQQRHLLQQQQQQSPRQQFPQQQQPQQPAALVPMPGLVGLGGGRPGMSWSEVTYGAEPPAEPPPP